jgi:maltooligosyltrehalose trehalohydrolase
LTGSSCLGATPLRGGGVAFLVWAPRAARVDVALYGPGGAGDEPPAATHPLEGPDGLGYFAGTVAGIGAGARYRYVLDGDLEHPLPDPASSFQPHGVPGPSEVIDTASFRWTDAGWAGRALTDLVIVEVHVGTATPGGTLDQLVSYVDELRALGVTAVELMPVAQFPGAQLGVRRRVPLRRPELYGGPRGLAAVRRREPRTRDGRG